MYNKRITLFLKGLALCSLFFFSWNPTFAQDGCSGGGPADITLDSIGTYTAFGTTQRAKAKKEYKKALAKGASKKGACPGSCTIGECTAVFNGYASDSTTPTGSSSGGNYIFNAPPGGTLSFSVNCDCGGPVTTTRVEIFEGEHQQHSRRTIWEGDGLDLSATTQSGFVFSPNPASDQITLRAHLHSATTPMIVHLSNVQGQLMIVKELGALSKGQHRFEFDTQSLKPGIYFASIHSKDKILARSRIVIQR